MLPENLGGVMRFLAGLLLLAALGVGLSLWIAEDPGTSPDRPDVPSPERGDVPAPAPAAVDSPNDEAPVGLSGLVRTADGRPRSGVPVFGLPMERISEFRTLQTVSGEDGRYAFPEVPPVPYMVFALGGGYASRGLARARRHGANPFVLAVPAGAGFLHDLEVESVGLIRGQVYGQGGGVCPIATVTAHGADPGWAVRSIFELPEPPTDGTDHYGRYRVWNLVPDLPYRLTATANGSLPAVSGPHRVGSGEFIDVDLTFGPSRAMVLAVVDSANGEPVADARIEVYCESGGSWLEVPGTWKTNSAGFAIIQPLPTSRIAVEVHAEGYVGTEPRQAIAGSGESRGNLDAAIRLEKSLAIAGKIYGPDGSPLAGECVWAVRKPPGRRHSDGSFTNGEGEFRIGGLPPGEYALSIRCATATDESRHVTAKAGTEDLVIRLSPGEGKRPP
jgi:hypothetical protein